MNISQEEKQTVDGDSLEFLFKKQSIVEEDFAVIEGIPQRLIDGKIENLHLQETAEHIDNKILWRIVKETLEASVALKNAKSWRQTQYLTDVNEYLDEVADIMIYFINLCLASGISAEMLTQIVLKKIEVNRKRILSKY